MNRDLLPAAVVAVAVHAGVLVAMPSPFRPADAKVSVDDGLRVVMLAVTAAPQTETAPETPIDLPPPPTAPPPPPDAANAAISKMVDVVQV